MWNENIKWLEEQIEYIKKNGGFGAVSIRVNIRAGKEDIIEKISLITDKIKGSSIIATL